MPINDEKEEDDLWEEFKKTKSPALRDKFIRQYMPLVQYVAGKVAVGLPASVEFDDLVGYLSKITTMDEHLLSTVLATILVLCVFSIIKKLLK